VEALAAQQAAVLAQAEKHRAQDARDYEAARAASQALAERIRAAAARAEAARVAAAKKAAAEAAKAAAAAEAERRRRAAAGAAGAGGAGAAAGVEHRDGVARSRPADLALRHPGAPDLRRRPLPCRDRHRRRHGRRVRAARDGYVTYAGYASGYGTSWSVSHGTVGGRTCPRRTPT
jgi:septal ring factor EnvC (AmiA/AmiB activator)